MSWRTALHIALLSFAAAAFAPQSALADTCQCGDVSDDAAVDAGDVSAYRAFLADPVTAALPAEGVRKCTVIGSVPAACGIRDLVVLRRALGSELPGLADSCAAQIGDTGAGLVRFVAMGEQGVGNAAQSTVAAAVAQKCEQSCCDFVQLLGGNIAPFGVDSASDAQWSSKFEVPYAGVPLEFWALLGEEDYGGNQAGLESARAQSQIDYSASSSVFRMPATHWHRTVEHVEFFALDSPRQRYLQDAQQRVDVTAWLAASTTTWRIALGNLAYRSNGPHGNAGSYDGLPFIPITNGAGVKSFMDSIVCGNADVYFASNDLSLQWPSTTCAGTELIVSGAGAVTSALPGSNPVHFQASALGFVWVEIDGDTLSAEFVDSTGATLYSRSISLP